MRSRNAAWGARKRHGGLSSRLFGECLETRQMMAGDLRGDLGADFTDILVEFRTFDGTVNNLENPDWGSSGEQLLRIAAADYADGISSPGGEDRPSAREISNLLAAQDAQAEPSDRQLSAFIYVWGQFLDHDIDLTEPNFADPQAFPIQIPAGDVWFDPNNTGAEVIPLTRSTFDPATGVEPARPRDDNPRQQINKITAWIDGSMIYGSSQDLSDSLRTFEGGRLATSAGELLPTDEFGAFLAGDIRANENIALTSLHALFVREHNHWADHIAENNPQLSDEQIFQQARSIVIAEIQAITYNEFLPALLGRGVITDYQGYDPDVNPAIANEFSTAAFRLGHSLINDDVEFFGDDGRPLREEVSLSEAFFNPDLLRETGIDSILKYSASSVSQELDNQIVDSLRNFLFGQPGSGGLDLASLNIQRGRDHGLADYNAVRQAYGLDPIETFDQISSDPDVQQALAELYSDVDNIDLWVGALAEDHVRGGSVGEVVQTIVADQFQRLRDGDRFWYENVFTGRELRELQRTSLAEVIERNTSITNLQANVFFMRAELTGEVLVDRNANGRQDRREPGLEGMTVELLNDQGDLIATTVTDQRGRYDFTQFEETGDYQVRVVVPDGRAATGSAASDVLVSRGDISLRGVDFGIAEDDGSDDGDDRRPRPRGRRRN